VTPAELTGRSRTHVLDLAELGSALHVHTVAPFLAMRREALAAGFDLVPVSSFRDFERQLGIWNAKFNGEKPLHDAAGGLLVAAELSPAERVDAILIWSALPGASRHHWGTDLDLIDRAAVPTGYRVQLSAEEFAPTGPFAAVSGWLEVNSARFGFFRPFRGVESGVQREDWHYSFAPLAESARQSLTPHVLRAALADAPLQGKEEIFGRLDALHARYVAAIDLP
jgi:LAS superfamily LD-carboxypeptidase LdcB